jgi:hypothetical protein
MIFTHDLSKGLLPLGFYLYYVKLYTRVCHIVALHIYIQKE